MSAAQATGQSSDRIALHALRMGSPPDWKDIPPEFQADVAGLDRLDDTALWRVDRFMLIGSEEREKNFSLRPPTEPCARVRTRLFISALYAFQEKTSGGCFSSDLIFCPITFINQRFGHAFATAVV